MILLPIFFCSFIVSLGVVSAENENLTLLVNISFETSTEFDHETGNSTFTGIVSFPGTDEDIGAKICEQNCGNGTCLNNSCACFRGYIYNNVTEKCEDENECESQPEICGNNSVCRNNEGNYSCDCLEGFQRAGENGTCEDINECLAKSCPQFEICVNNPGNFTCICEGGFVRDEESSECVGKDFCTQHGGHETCAKTNAVCLNDPTSFKCRCRAGFMISNGVCLPATVTVVGVLNLLVTNAEGLPSTNSEIFWKLLTEIELMISSVTSVDAVQVISLMPVQNGNSNRSTKSKIEVICTYAVMLNESINNVDRLISDLIYSSCQNFSTDNDDCRFGPDLLIKSKEALQNSSEYFDPCKDEWVEDYCPNELGNCESIPEGGGYKCKCNKGLRFLTQTGNFPLCLDIDECAMENICTADNRKCINTFGSYSCSECKEGYYFADGTCQEICQPNPCQNGGTCYMTGSNSYECGCSHYFGGKHCEKPFTELRDTRFTLYIVSGILVALVVLGFVAGDKWGMHRERKIHFLQSTSTQYARSGQFNPAYQPSPTHRRYGDYKSS